MKSRYLILSAVLMATLVACGKSDDPRSEELPANISALMFLEHRFPNLSTEERSTLRNYMMRRFAQDNFGLFEGIPGYDASPRAKTVGEAIVAQAAWENEFGGLMQKVPEMLEQMVPGFSFEYYEGETGEGRTPGLEPDWESPTERRSHSI